MLHGSKQYPTALSGMREDQCHLTPVPDNLSSNKGNFDMRKSVQEGHECQGFNQRFHDCADLLALIKTCSKEKDLQRGSRIHFDLLKQGLLKKNIFLGTALLDMYGKCGVVEKAQQVFDELPYRDQVAWNALISGYAQSGLGEKALECFKRMQDGGLFPDLVTYVCVLKACGSIRALEKGKEIDSDVRRQGLLKDSVVIGNALVDMYVKCGELSRAQVVLDRLPTRNVVTWTTIIAGYAQHGHGEKALKCFERMRDEGIPAEPITFIFTFKACVSIGAMDKAEEIHVEVHRRGLLKGNIMLGTALADMYAKCGMLTKAEQVFDELPLRDLVAWNALIAGYVQHGHGEEALWCFGHMQDEGFFPNEVTFICALKACSIMGTAEKGKDIHAEVRRQGLLGKSIVLGNALIDMYAKCGALSRARKVFDRLPVHNVVSWTALIAGYAQLGKVEDVFASLYKMTSELVEPNVVTFAIVLSACSHAGILEEGQMYFELMRNVYCVCPNLEHYICMVDLYSRAGYFDKAVLLIEQVPPTHSFPLWSGLLGACQKWLNVELAMQAFKHVNQLDEKDVAAYVCMRNVYAVAGMPEKAVQVEALGMKNGATMIPWVVLVD